MESNDQKTHIDLFSGIGGFSLAAGWAGFETIAFCEKDEFCQKVLQARFGGIVIDPISNKHRCKESKSLSRTESIQRINQQKNRASRKFGRTNSISFFTKRYVPIIPDIRDFDGKEWRGATLLTGGFPCQPFSVAGQRRGKEDDRHLWPEMFRVIKEARPRWVLAENVSGIVKMALDEMLADLKTKATPQGRLLFQLVPRTPPIEEIGSGLLPTAKSRDWKGGSRSPNYQNQSNLPDAVKMLPTPDASDRRGPGSKQKGLRNVMMEMLPTPNAWDGRRGPGKEYNPKSKSQKDRTLETAVQKGIPRMLPTPRAGNPGSRPNEKGGKILAEEIKMLPTPHSTCSTGAGRQGRKGGLNIQTTVGKRAGLKLHPDFALWMMGYPLDWLDVHCETRTASKDSRQPGTQSSPKSLLS